MNALPNDRPPRNAGADWRASMREAGPYLGLGMQLALAMLFFTGGGYLLDHALDLAPWLTIVGAVLGMVAVFAQLIRISHDLSRRSKDGRDRPSRRGDPPAS